MSRLPHRSVLLAFALSLGSLGAGCQLIVDPDARELGDGGALPVDATLPRFDASPPRDAGAGADGEVELPDGSGIEDGAAVIPVDAGTCGTIVCPSTMYCDDSKGSAECLSLPSCDNVVCEVGSMCQLVDVLCFKAPCPPLPRCVNTPTCFPPCGFGRHCESILGLSACVLNTSSPDAGTVRDAGTTLHDAGSGADSSNSGSSCGKASCAAGLECCNASCGTCVEPGRACSQIACN